MTRTHLLTMLAAAAALAGCNKESHTIVSGGPPEDNVTVNNANVQLPPSIVGTKQYRCDDNSVVTIDYLSDNLSANVHGEKGAPVVRVTAPAAGQPMVAEGGYSVEGSPSSASAKISVPGHANQTCNA